VVQIFSNSAGKLTGAREKLMCIFLLSADERSNNAVLSFMYVLICMDYWTLGPYTPFIEKIAAAHTMVA